MEEAGDLGEEEEEGTEEDVDDDGAQTVLPEIVDPKPTRKKKPPTFPAQEKRTKKKISKDEIKCTMISVNSMLLYTTSFIISLIGIQT